ncbi:isoform a [Stylonychia lemnae]|uniref:Isoform a n=1 Tax=Stylonychia lemnae TaxID=5949 RepID=A0A078AEB3_STYLE|nr:isoform a [Stylonychia lemnae]|eukprot:CDW79258.1 isoform a [Stylonychia lemnae]
MKVNIRSNKDLMSFQQPALKPTSFLIDYGKPKSNNNIFPAQGEQTSLNIGGGSPNMGNLNSFNQPDRNKSYISNQDSLGKLGSVGYPSPSHNSTSNAYQDNMRSRQLFGDYDPFRDRKGSEQKHYGSNKELKTFQPSSESFVRADSRTKDMQSIRKRSMMGEIGSSLIHPQSENTTNLKSKYNAESQRRAGGPPNNISVTNSMSNYQVMRDQMQREKDRGDIMSAGGMSPKDSHNNSDLLGRAAGLTINETERLRDMKHNFAADHLRKQHVIENEKGGIFDRSENSGVKNMYIPASNNVNEEIQAQFYKNKQKHWQHVNKFSDDNAQSSLIDVVNPDNMTSEDKRAFINQKLQYMQLNVPGSAPNVQIGQYEISLKRRHGAKKQIQQRQNKLKAQMSMLNERSKSEQLQRDPQIQIEQVDTEDNKSVSIDKISISVPSVTLQSKQEDVQKNNGDLEVPDITPKRNQQSFLNNLKNLFSFSPKSKPDANTHNSQPLQQQRKGSHSENDHKGDSACSSVSSDDEEEEKKLQRDESAFIKQFEYVENTREQYLILLVHGIGTKEAYQAQNIKEFRASIEKVCKRYFKNTNYDFVIKMVDWKSILNNKHTKEKVDRVTVVDGAQSVREVFNETVVDILFYLSQQYRTQILNKVAQEARTYYNELSQGGKNKRFKGKVTWVGHSLGTAISYDLLARQQPAKPSLSRKSQTRHLFEDLSVDKDEATNLQSDSSNYKMSPEDEALQLGFNIEHYFLLGSPLGLFVSIYNEENFIKEKLPTTKNFYNIFHPADFIAYRIEPLFSNNDLGGVQNEIKPPVKLPYYKNNGYRTYLSISNFFKQNPNSIVHSAFQQINEIQQQLKAQEAEQLLKDDNASLRQTDADGERLGGYGTHQNDEDFDDECALEDQRYDFLLQEKGLETIIKPVGILKAHIKYFSSKDVAYFILKKIHKHKDIPYYL